MSQPGSPQAMLASLLLQLQRGQAEIAGTTQQGLKQLADSIAQSAKRHIIVDVKGIGKPDVLKGTHEEFKRFGRLGHHIRLRRGLAVSGAQDKRHWNDPITAHDLLNSLPLQVLMQLIHICMWH